MSLNGRVDMASGSIIGQCLCPPLLKTCSSPLSSQFKASSSSSSSFSCNNSCQTSYSLSPPAPLMKTVSDINNSGVIACLRAPSAELALGAARAALRGGIKVLEVVMSTPGFATACAGVSDNNFGRTVLNAEDASVAVKVGAKFLMSPAMIKELLADVEKHEVLYIPGVMTPTEILTAYNTGAQIVKVYPVSALGGVEYISALKKPFPHIPMVASQGITMGLVEVYITRGASAVVLSDAIFHKEAVSHGDFDTITERAQLAASIGDQAIKQLKPVCG